MRAAREEPPQIVRDREQGLGLGGALGAYPGLPFGHVLAADGLRYPLRALGGPLADERVAARKQRRDGGRDLFRQGAILREPPGEFGEARIGPAIPPQRIAVGRDERAGGGAAGAQGFGGGRDGAWMRENETCMSNPVAKRPVLIRQERARRAACRSFRNEDWPQCAWRRGFAKKNLPCDHSHSGQGRNRPGSTDTPPCRSRPLPAVRACRCGLRLLYHETRKGLWHGRESLPLCPAPICDASVKSGAQSPARLLRARNSSPQALLRSSSSNSQTRKSATLATTFLERKVRKA